MFRLILLTDTFPYFSDMSNGNWGSRYAHCYPKPRDYVGKSFVLTCILHCGPPLTSLLASERPAYEKLSHVHCIATQKSGARSTALALPRCVYLDELTSHYYIRSAKTLQISSYFDLSTSAPMNSLTMFVPMSTSSGLTGCHHTPVTSEIHMQLTPQIRGGTESGRCDPAMLVQDKILAGRQPLTVSTTTDHPGRGMNAGYSDGDPVLNRPGGSWRYAADVGSRLISGIHLGHGVFQYIRGQKWVAVSEPRERRLARVIEPPAGMGQQAGRAISPGEAARLRRLEERARARRRNFENRQLRPPPRRPYHASWRQQGRRGR